MGKIYTHASCNIAASDAPDSSHGALYARNPRTIQPDEIDGQYIFNRTDIFASHHILYTRAWVLQEALLARRTLNCGRGQLFWRCSQMRASEVWPGGVPTNVYPDDHPASKFKVISADGDQVILNANVLLQHLKRRASRDQIPRAPGKGSVERYTDAPFAFWAAIVGHYTEMNLTQDTDRPMAIAGITDVFRPFFGEHCFGMWRVFLPLELLWSVWSITKRPSTIRAPSWSWLSVEGQVQYTHCTFRYGRDLLVTKFVDIEGEKLILNTPLLRATSSGMDKRRAIISSVEGQTRWMRWHGIPTLPDSYGEIHFDHTPENSEQDVFLMCIQIHKEHSKCALGLVLREVEHGAFERLGYFSDAQLRTVPFLKRTVRRDVVLI
jgi:hypothetical protein